MRDGEIRSAVRDHLEKVHRNDPATLFRNELGLCLGETRVDVAVINGALSGYEIKSARDNLARFPSQVEIYGRVLDRATVVTEGRFVERVADFVEPWWGIWEAVESDGLVKIEEVRPETDNPGVDALAVAQLLWRDEAYDVLRERNLAAGLSRATRWDLWDRLAAEVPLEELRDVVRHRLRLRSDWPGG